MTKIRIAVNALAEGKPSVEVTLDDGTRGLFYGVQINGPSQIVSSHDGHAWVETDAHVTPIRSHKLANPPPVK